MNEYVLLDMIYHLSVHPSNNCGGWCYATKQTLGDWLGLSKQSIINLIDKLEVNGLLVRNQTTKHLKTTEKWSNEYLNGFTNGKESLPTVNKVDSYGKESLPNSGKESLPNNNNIYNNINNKEEAPQNETSQNLEIETQYFEIIETEKTKPTSKRQKKIERKEVGPESYENRKLSESEQILLNDLQFREAWQELLTTKKWRNKSQSAINMSLKRLSEFCPEFSTILCQNAIAGQYQGVVFPDTPNHYARWQQAKGQTMTAGEKLLERQKRMIMQGFMGGQGINSNDVL